MLRIKHKPILVFSASLASFFLCASSMAINLGPGKIISNLGQPLQVEIEVLRWQGVPTSDIDIDIGSSRDYSALGVSYEKSYKGLQAKLQKPTSDGKLKLLITGNKNVTNPNLNLVLDLNSQGVTIRKKYHLRVNQKPAIEKTELELPLVLAEDTSTSSQSMNAVNASSKLMSDTSKRINEENEFISYSEAFGSIVESPTLVSQGKAVTSQPLKETDILNKQNHQAEDLNQLTAELDAFNSTFENNTASLPFTIDASKNSIFEPTNKHTDTVITLNDDSLNADDFSDPFDLLTQATVPSEQNTPDIEQANRLISQQPSRQVVNVDEPKVISSGTLVENKLNNLDIDNIDVENKVNIVAPVITPQLATLSPISEPLSLDQQSSTAQITYPEPVETTKFDTNIKQSNENTHIAIEPVSKEQDFSDPFHLLNQSTEQHATAPVEVEQEIKQLAESLPSTLHNIEGQTITSSPVPLENDLHTQDAIEPSMTVNTMADLTSNFQDDYLELYQMRSGDTLLDIALGFLPSAKNNHYQMFLAIHRLNPEAFSDNNITLLKGEQEIMIPTQTQLDDIDFTSAKVDFEHRWSQGLDDFFL